MVVLQKLLKQSYKDNYELEEPLGLENKQPLLWWKEHELLYKYLSLLSKKFLCITATSVPSERLFSAAGNLVAEKRSRLISDNIDKLVFLYENKMQPSYISQVIATVV